MIFKIIEFVESNNDSNVYRGVNENGRLANRILNCPDLSVGDLVRVNRLLSTKPGVHEMEYSFIKKISNEEDC